MLHDSISCCYSMLELADVTMSSRPLYIVLTFHVKVTDDRRLIGRGPAINLLDNAFQLTFISNGTAGDHASIRRVKNSPVEIERSLHLTLSFNKHAIPFAFNKF